MLTYLQAIVIALVQGVTELFPVSSLGHSVLVPAWFGGSWETLVTQSSQANSESSFYLAFIVALHVATALALLWFFRADWVRIVTGFFRSAPRSLRERRLSAADSDERLAWLIVLATIPVGLTGLAFEHVFRTVFAKPVAASVLADPQRTHPLRRRAAPAGVRAASEFGGDTGERGPRRRILPMASAHLAARAPPRTSPRPTRQMSASPASPTSRGC